MQITFPGRFQFKAFLRIPFISCAQYTKADGSIVPWYLQCLIFMMQSWCEKGEKLVRKVLAWPPYCVPCLADSEVGCRKMRGKSGVICIRNASCLDSISLSYLLTFHLLSQYVSAYILIGHCYIGYYGILSYIFYKWQEMVIECFSLPLGQINSLVCEEHLFMDWWLV